MAICRCTVGEVAIEACFESSTRDEANELIFAIVAAESARLQRANSWRPHCVRRNNRRTPFRHFWSHC